MPDDNPNFENVNTNDSLPAPRNGAGLFDVDPDQSGVTQDPNVIVRGDIEVFSEDVEP